LISRSLASRLGTGAFGGVEVQVHLRGRKAHRATAHRIVDQCLHRGDLVVGRFALERGITHDVTANGGMPDVAAEVDAELPLA
jgi:hypothetical protein